MAYSLHECRKSVRELLIYSWLEENSWRRRKKNGQNGEHNFMWKISLSLKGRRQRSQNFILFTFFSTCSLSICLFPFLCEIRLTSVWIFPAMFDTIRFSLQLYKTPSCLIPQRHLRALSSIIIRSRSANIFWYAREKSATSEDISFTHETCHQDQPSENVMTWASPAENLKSSPAVTRCLRTQWGV